MCHRNIEIAVITDVSHSWEVHWQARDRLQFNITMTKLYFCCNVSFKDPSSDL